jgi:hypothetical protein
MHLTDGRVSLTGNQQVARPLPKQDNTNTSMPQSGLEPTIPAFERVKIFRALDNAAKIQIFNLRYLSKTSLN